MAEEQNKENKGNVVFVTKLPLDVTKKEVEEVFDRFGQITDISIKKSFTFVVGTGDRDFRGGL